MDEKVILFDLDGTLTDSGEGITNCARLALEHFDIHAGDLRYFVGPPLRDSFLKAGVPEDGVEEAITIYRSRYNTIGKYENSPYPGIREVLESLKAQGHRLFVATSKPEIVSVDILKKFDLYRYFELVCGATFDRSRDTKASVIAYLLEKAGSSKNIIMVGDTAYDVIGAAAHKIPTIGVAWGYGNVEEMKENGAVAIAHTMEELLFLLQQ